MSEQKFVVRFEGLSPAESGVETQRLQELLADSSPGVNATLRRDKTEAQDMGATLLLLLGTPAIIAVAKGIAAYMGKRGERPGTLVIERVAADGSVERVHFQGASPDAAKVAQALQPPAPSAPRA